MSSSHTLENPWYYLENFEFVLRWIIKRYSDLLLPDERDLIHAFLQSPRPSRGLLVRMVMRKGCLFRASRLRYAEIGNTALATQILVRQGWISEDPILALDELFSLLTKPELAALFRPQLALPGMSTAPKSVQLEALRSQFPEARRFSEWASLGQALGNSAATASADCSGAGSSRRQLPGAGMAPPDAVYKLDIHALSDRFRLMFFGNLRQDWTEFVLADLGLYIYERVDFATTSRAFHTRHDVDAYLHLHYCKEQFAAGAQAADAAAIAGIQNAIPPRHDNDWLEERRGKLLFQIGQYHERSGNWADALHCYSGCAYPGARARRIRVLERGSRYGEALALAQASLQSPESEAEHQHLTRMMPRLLRRSGAPAPIRKASGGVPRTQLKLPAPGAALRVEEQVRNYLQTPHAPVFYVENTLINALFGLLCWDAIFAAIPGAFFHPFQQGPADLLRADFPVRRHQQFSTCLAQLASGQYQQTILHNFSCKAGIQSPFVAWGFITPDVLAMALACIPAQHLEIAFQRLMKDLRSNRSGLPDLVQFWPAEQRYQMIEVKGPGDRLQDNQIRWLDYCHAHHIPVTVCYVQHEAAPTS